MPAVPSRFGTVPRRREGDHRGNASLKPQCNVSGERAQLCHPHPQGLAIGLGAGRQAGRQVYLHFPLPGKTHLCVVGLGMQILVLCYYSGKVLSSRCPGFLSGNGREDVMR